MTSSPLALQSVRPDRDAGDARGYTPQTPVNSGIYIGPVFDMARRQFDQVADHLNIAADERKRIFMPKRAIAVSCPIHRDDGSVAVFNG